MNGDDLMRAEDHFGMLAVFVVPARHFFDQRDMIRTEVGEDILHPEIGQALEEIVRSAMTADMLFSL